MGYFERSSLEKRRLWFLAFFLIAIVAIYFVIPKGQKGDGESVPQVEFKLKAFINSVTQQVKLAINSIMPGSGDDSIPPPSGNDTTPSDPSDSPDPPPEDSPPDPPSDAPPTWIDISILNAPGPTGLPYMGMVPGSSWPTPMELEGIITSNGYNFLATLVAQHTGLLSIVEEFTMMLGADGSIDLASQDISLSVPGYYDIWVVSGSAESVRKDFVVVGIMLVTSTPSVPEASMIIMELFSHELGDYDMYCSKNGDFTHPDTRHWTSGDMPLAGGGYNWNEFSIVGLPKGLWYWEVRHVATGVVSHYYMHCTVDVI